jgi:hypothetical protein
VASGYRKNSQIKSISGKPITALHAREFSPTATAKLRQSKKQKSLAGTGALSVVDGGDFRKKEQVNKEKRKYSSVPRAAPPSIKKGDKMSFMYEEATSNVPRFNMLNKDLQIHKNVKSTLPRILSNKPTAIVAPRERSKS